MCRSRSARIQLPHLSFPVGVQESSCLICGKDRSLVEGDVGGVLEPSGCETCTARTFPADAAVGLLSRERLTLQGTLGGGGGGEALRALGSEVAVGANKPVVGRGGREAERPAVPFPRLALMTPS
jgi:hypothetical protein